MEYTIVKQKDGKTKLALKGQIMLKKLRSQKTIGTWFEEAMEYNLESSPLEPYNNNVSQWLNIEQNLVARRQEAQELLDKDEYILSCCTFPRVGCPNFTGMSTFVFIYPSVNQCHITRVLQAGKLNFERG